MNQALRSETDIRSKAIDWDVDELPDQISSEKLNSLFRSAWNGMRRLPYTDSEIADAFGSIATLLLSGFGQSIDVKEDARCFCQCFGDSIRVGFTSGDGSGSRGYVSCESLRNALRDDMVELLAQDYKERAADFEELFSIIYNPSLMFDFDAFKSAFAREIIPAQVVLERSPILFNPAQLKIFGIP